MFPSISFDTVASSTCPTYTASLDILPYIVPLLTARGSKSEQVFAALAYPEHVAVPESAAPTALATTAEVCASRPCFRFRGGMSANVCEKQPHDRRFRTDTRNESSVVAVRRAWPTTHHPPAHP
jgi:hypothetical protein